MNTNDILFVSVALGPAAVFGPLLLISILRDLPRRRWLHTALVELRAMNHPTDQSTAGQAPATPVHQERAAA